MPTLNYKDAGALVEYDYLQGTIVTLDPNNDTASVSGECGSLSEVPIFYHCKDNAVKRDNGALEGAAGAFTVGDKVVVLVGRTSDVESLGKHSYIVGRHDGVKRCSGEDCVVVYSWIGYNDYDKVIEYWFIWDIDSDNYATDVLVYDQELQHERPRAENDFPAPYNEGNWNTWAEDRFYKTAISSSQIDIEHFEGRIPLIDNRIRVGDYVYESSKPQNWAYITAIELHSDSQSMFVIDNRDIILPNKTYTISVSLPLFYLSDTWEVINISWNNPQLIAKLCSTTVTWPKQTTPQVVEGCGLYEQAVIISSTTRHWDNINGGFSDANEGDASGSCEVTLDPTCGSAVCYTGPWGSSPGVPEYLTATGTYWDPDPDGILMTFNAGINGASVQVAQVFEYWPRYRLKYLCNYTNGYTASFISGREKKLSTSAVNHNAYQKIFYPRDELGYQVDSIRTATDGIKDPLGSIQYENIDYLYSVSGDYPICDGRFAEASIRSSAQFYTYPAYDRNTHAQSRKRSSRDEVTTTYRSTRLESAIKKLLDITNTYLTQRLGEDDTRIIRVSGQFYSGKRIA